MTDERKIVTTEKRSLTIQPGSGAANVIDQVLSDTLALARSSEVSKEVFTEINGIMFDQLSVKQLDIWAKAILIDQNEDSAIFGGVALSQLVELMNSTFFELKSDYQCVGTEHWVCDGIIVAACFPTATHWRKGGGLDLSQLPGLSVLLANRNQLTELDVSKNPKLTELLAYQNQLTELDVSNNLELIELRASRNQLTDLDVSNNPKLSVLLINRNQLTELDVSNNLELTELRTVENQLTELDVSNNLELIELWASRNQLTDLDVSNNPELFKLHVGSNLLTELDLSNNPKLTDLNVETNQLTELRFSNEMDLENERLIRIPSDLKFDKLKGCYTNE